MSKKIVSKIRTSLETSLQGIGCLLLFTACVGLFVGALCYFTGDHVDRAEMNKAFASVWSGKQSSTPRTVASKTPAVKQTVLPAAGVVAPSTAHAIAPDVSKAEELSEEIAANAPQEPAHPHN